MKKVLSSITILTILILSYINIEASMISIKGSDNMSTSTVICSSSTATLLLSANVYRKGIEIKNDDAFIVRISTWQTSSQSTGHPISASGGTYQDSIESYTGALYGISTGTGTATVSIVEKSGILYQ